MTSVGPSDSAHLPLRRKGSGRNGFLKKLAVRAAGSNKKSKATRSITFGPISSKAIDPIPFESGYDVYYTGVELRELWRQEVLAVRKAIESNQDVETHELTRRGIEDFLDDGNNKKLKLIAHTVGVLEEWHIQKQHGYTDANELRQVSKILSKQDQLVAKGRGQQDGEEAGQIGIKQSTSSKASKVLRASFRSLSQMKLDRMA